MGTRPYGPRAFAKILRFCSAEYGKLAGAMSDNPPDPEKLREFEERLSKARGRAPLRIEETPPSKLGIAFRLSTELVAAVVVGGLIGWALDWFLGTSPFLLIVMFFLGVAAGFRNVIRASRQLNEPPPPPSRGGG